MSDSAPPYSYGERHIGDLASRRLGVRNGRLAAAASVTLGILCLLGVFCFRFPAQLTTPDLRPLYNLDMMRVLLSTSMATSVALAFISWRHPHNRAVAVVALASVLSAFLLGGTSIPVGEVESTGAFIGLDWFVLDLLLSIAVFVGLEKTFPKYGTQTVLRPGWRLDLSYFGLNHLGVGLFLLMSNRCGLGASSMMRHSWASDYLPNLAALPVLVQFVLLVALTDLVQYWVHRAAHEVPWLWRFHAVHHSAEHMDWLAGSRIHFLEPLFQRALITLPLFLLSPSESALNAYVLFVSFQAVFIHTNCGLNLSWLRYILAIPQFHHWHHASDAPGIDTNYSANLPLWDLLFGTFHLPKDFWPKAYGTRSPLPQTFIGQFLYPFLGASRSRERRPVRSNMS